MSSSSGISPEVPGEFLHKFLGKTIRNSPGILLKVLREFLQHFLQELLCYFCRNFIVFISGSSLVFFQEFVRNLSKISSRIPPGYPWAFLRNFSGSSPGISPVIPRELHHEILKIQAEIGRNSPRSPLEISLVVSREFLQEHFGNFSCSSTKIPPGDLE